MDKVIRCPYCVLARDFRPMAKQGGRGGASVPSVATVRALSARISNVVARTAWPCPICTAEIALLIPHDYEFRLIFY
jgi:hypothetical protein